MSPNLNKKRGKKKYHVKQIKKHNPVLQTTLTNIRHDSL